MDDLISQLNSTNSSDFTDDSSRISLLNAARSLVSRLERPWERIYRLAICDPTIFESLKIARDVNLFPHLSASTPKPASALANATSTDPAFLSRILRVLVVAQCIAETGPDAYIANDFTLAMQDPNGLVRGIDLFYDQGLPYISRLPAYFATNGYRNPTTTASAPWKWIENVPDWTGPRWAYLDSFKTTCPLTPNDTRAAVFNSFLSSVRQNQPSLAKLHSFPELSAGEVFVDVGGGKGADITSLAPLHTSTKFVLQDRAPLLSSLSQASFPENVQLQPHDFFTSNPINNAQVYFLHSVLHDWPDAEAREILLAIKAAMKPGFSRVVLMERVMEARDGDNELLLACMDIQMMANFAALERSEAQWRGLIESAGLKYDGRRAVHASFNLIEATLNES